VLSDLLINVSRSLTRRKGAIPFFFAASLVCTLTGFVADPTRVDVEASQVVTHNGVQIANNNAKVVPLVNGRAEAELGDLTGVNIETTNPNFSGTGYVTGIDSSTDKISITVNAPAGLYELAFGYASSSGDKGVDFQVNDEPGSGTLKQTSIGFSCASVGKFLLKEGLNTINIYQGWGYFDIDYIQLTPTSVLLPAKPPKVLVDDRATQSTKGLFSYLVDQYGSKVISGQQDDVEYIVEKTGKEPAIGSFDLIDY